MSINNSWILKVIRSSSASLFGLCFFSNVLADINWHQCEEMPDSEFQCATVYVPLNHQQHIGSYAAYKSEESVVGIALARLPASDHANKIGTLFLNPGGPGGSGVNMLFGAGHALFNEEVRSYYDLVGFDPRGIARSDELACFKDINEILHFYDRPFFPVNSGEVNQSKELDRYLSDLCDARAGELINHMSTADVARDLDLLRHAVGDDKLHFAGYSYGSYLGVTYANLFPENVGAMIVDGVLDPIAWSTGRGWASYFFPYSTRLRSAEGSRDTLDEFFRNCDEAGIELCALAGDAKSRYASVIESIREEPLVIIDNEGNEIVIDYATMVLVTLGALYDSETWPLLASDIAAIDEHLSSAEIAKRHQELRRYLGLENDQPDALLQQPSDLGYFGVSCSDSDNPYSYYNWAWSARISDSLYKYFGSAWTWRSSICYSWPGSKESRYVDGFRVNTENPVLIINTLFDPATPYHGAKIVNKLLKNSRLLTVNGWGHTSAFLSECADNVVSDYLLTGRLPEKGASCDVDAIPFSRGTAVDSSANMQRPLAESQDNDIERKELRRKLLKDMLPYNLH